MGEAMESTDKRLRKATKVPKRYMTVNLSQTTFDWVDRVCKATGKNRSWVIEDILLDNLPEAYQNETS
jgi:metal-responsive CopG/Arc/MetJ family transcriptional regulator